MAFEPEPVRRVSMQEIGPGMECQNPRGEDGSHMGCLPTQGREGIGHRRIREVSECGWGRRMFRTV